ncbi:MAG: hypothetical protein H7A25_21695 [Leptospiraceae bacterium]|nr:hypothetical protein [Leptospiraceae bacterium]MCP5502527.1 hypothetical protein [Leptospiraceae bacterium]
MANEYIYRPLQDSLIGQLVLKLWSENGGDVAELQKALDSNLEGTSFQYHGTKKARKQVLMTTLPVEIRKELQKGRQEIILQKLSELIRGNFKDNKVPEIDVFLELFEWLLAGFDESALQEKLLHLLFNQKLSFSPDFLSRLKVLYEMAIEEEMKSIPSEEA